MIKESVIFKMAICVSTFLHFICIGIVWSNTSTMHNFSMGISPSSTIEISIFRYNHSTAKKNSESFIKQIPTPPEENLSNSPKKHFQKTFYTLSSITGRMGKNKKSSGKNYNEWLNQIRQKLEDTASSKYKVKKYFSVPISFRIDFTGNPKEIKFIQFTPKSIKNICEEIICNASPYPLPKDKEYLKKEIRVTFTFRP